MDFITMLSRTVHGVDSIWVIVDRLTKSDHFVLIAEIISIKKLADIYIKETMVRHGVPVSVVS